MTGRRQILNKKIWYRGDKPTKVKDFGVYHFHMSQMTFVFIVYVRSREKFPIPLTVVFTSSTTFKCCRDGIKKSLC